MKQFPDDLEKAYTAISENSGSGSPKKNLYMILQGCFRVYGRYTPFREGNTRTVVMMMTLFVEHYGYYMDHELMAASAGYVRDSFVMASLDQVSSMSIWSAF